VEGLRLALLLLDNAAELQMQRRIESELAEESFREELRLRLLADPSEPRSPSAREIVEWEPLSQTQKRAIERYFEPKVRYLAERGGVIDAGLVGPLIHLHRYRNEAYHNARVRPETIRAASLILLEINCQLLVALRLRAMVDAGNSWVTDRFGVRGLDLMNPQGAKSVASQLREGLLPTAADVAETLADHLELRLDELADLLDYVVDATSIGDAAEAFSVAQHRAAAHRGDVGFTEADYDRFEPPTSLGDLDRIRESLAGVRSAVDRLEAFGRYAALESELEPSEEAVFGLVHAVDEWINLEIDRRRGN
jgi:hypothetical protein